MFLRRVGICLAAAMLASLLQVATVSSPAAAARGFTPQPGVTFNSAIGSEAKRRQVITKIIKTIKATPRREEIRIMTWNLQSTAAVDAMLRAQRRNVRVQLLMARTNAVRIENESFRRLQRGLKRGNRGRPADRRSWARLCGGSCRGENGTAHAKFYLFSKSGRARNVLIQGSANLTAASAHNQWNDIYTTTRRSGPYGFTRKIFTQMAKDRPVRPPYASWQNNGEKLAFFPGVGRRSGDPVMQLLNKVRCRGATNTASGRTRIRIVPDVIREQRGMELGRKVRRLWLDGCDIRIGYTVIGKDVSRMLRAPSRRGPVPLRHMVEDVNGDGQFDNYFHMKAMTIVGNVGGRRANHVVLNGSSNWSTVADRSDENIGVYWRKGLTNRYQEHIIYWLRHFDRRNAAAAAADSPLARTTAAQGGLTDDGLLFGTGPVNGVDPYANVDMD
ncbi:phospholipase D-like domain-containing protein [Nocardioides euryhalodurans]|nr:phospholipase D-like domain-containing protein [Nocardioides euryhalodurans]